MLYDTRNTAELDSTHSLGENHGYPKLMSSNSEYCRLRVTLIDFLIEIVSSFYNIIFIFLIVYLYYKYSKLGVYDCLYKELLSSELAE